MFNLDGSLYKLHYPSGNIVTYDPGGAGLALSAKAGNNVNYVTSATYSPNGAPTGSISGYSTSFAGITNAFSYNKRLQPINMSANSPSQTVFSIGYDFHLGNGTTGADNGNVYGITNYKDTTRSQTFTYDVLNRLASARNAGTDCTATVIGGLKKFWGNNYTYDAWGNLIGKYLLQTPAPAACAGENLIATADAHNWLHATGGPDYQYDAAGNMTFNATPPTQNYTYDQENRLIGAAGYAYTYDADGNRVRKSNSSSTGTLYWYMTPGIVGESDLSGNLTDEYVFFDGERVARKSTNGVFYYFSDHLKTASVITDASGNIKSESDFYPWGGELQFVANDSNHYKFTGKERDGETQLDYFGARYYSNGLGRWVSADWSPTPIPVPYADFGDPQSLNLYTYVRNIPTTKVDGDGHETPIVNDPQAMKEFGDRFSENTEKLTNFLAQTFTVDNFRSALDSIADDFNHFMAKSQQGLCSCNSQPAPQWQEERDNNNSHQQSSTEQGRDAQGKFTSKQPGQSAPGAAAEREALEAVGATKNTEAIPGSNRIPDGRIQNAAGKVEQYVEGKSVASVSNTAQLRQMAAAAMKATGKPLKLVTTNPNVKIAKTVLQNENIEIVRLNQK